MSAMKPAYSITIAALVYVLFKLATLWLVLGQALNAEGEVAIRAQLYTYFDAAALWVAGMVALYLTRLHWPFPREDV